MLSGANHPKSAARQAIIDHYHADEAHCVRELLNAVVSLSAKNHEIQQVARGLIVKVREAEAKKSGIESLMVHYDLSTEEGIMLMCLAEALLRIPDKQTEQLLIRDKLTSADWESHVGQGESAFINMATWGLALTGKVLKQENGPGFKKIWKGFIRRSSEPVVRKAVREAIKVMSEHFVLGRDIDEALKLSQSHMQQGYCYSYDMLGEGARTLADAEVYFEAYHNAIKDIGRSADHSKPLYHRPSISVKLSALYPRYEFQQQSRAVPFLTEKLKKLCLAAKEVGIALTVDAEEADRLDISLDIFEAVFVDEALGDWQGLGLAIQAYQKRAPYVLKWIAELARQQKKRIRVRLVKGAYWDSEIKHAQEMGYTGYPVYTRKVSTDVSYLACAKLLLTEMQDAIYPQFATHNAYTVAAILTMVDESPEKLQLEFQSLQGMGQALHDQLIARHITCRIYAPVGSHEDLLPYLVRRLLENGANSSFVNQIADKSIPLDRLVESPMAVLETVPTIPNDKIPLPADIYGVGRLNSAGLTIADYNELTPLQEQMSTFAKKTYFATPMHRKQSRDDQLEAVKNPADHSDVVGNVLQGTIAEVDQAITKSTKAFNAWSRMPIGERADILRNVGDLLEQHHAELMTLTMREAGKVLPDTISEIREAVDFCRYYANEAERLIQPMVMKGYTGESNTLTLRGRGPFLCISPWNFPVAIFTGQIAAALASGNTVIAKPSAQTALIAARVVELFHEAGVPKDVLQFMPGPGRTVGEALVVDTRIAGVVFTGSTATAKHIQQRLAERDAPIAPFIAETGGINAMIADSSALPEQLVDDVILSAFGSAGQRCSALRVLFIQDEVADKIIEMLTGAMKTLVVGNPNQLTTDVGPVIDLPAKKSLEEHLSNVLKVGRLIYRCDAKNLPEGTFVMPHAVALNQLSDLNREAFGPILHVIRYAKKDLDRVIDEINGLNYGLTFGIQSRINETVEYIASRINAGNIYVNRNMIGAVVGLQPFGGNRFSGTGPKAGGPHYLLRMCSEHTLTINTTAAGGNASLMELD